MARVRHHPLVASALLAACFASHRAFAVEAPGASRTETQPPLLVTSNTDCPSGSDVLAALAAMAPPAEWPHGSVRIHATTDLLLVDLMFEESARREVSAPADCHARAATVALVIATWTGKLPSDAAAMPVLPGPAPANASTPVAPAPTTPAPTPPPSVVTQHELGAGLLVAFSGGIAPGIALHFAQSRIPRGLGWQAALTLPARRDRSAAGGTTGWTRAAASVGLSAGAPLASFTATIEAGIAGAYTLTSGQGYSIDQGSEALTAGAFAGGRLSLPWRRLHLWTELRAYRWLLPQKVAVTTAEGLPVATVDLPSSDFHCTVGISYVFR